MLSIHVTRLMYCQLLKLGKRIFHKSALQKDLADLCGNKKIPVLKMIRRVITRWNTTSNVINHGLQLRPALDALCIKSDHNRGKPPVKRLKCFRLTDVEWTVLQQLHPILTVSRFHTLLSLCQSYSISLY